MFYVLLYVTYVHSSYHLDGEERERERVRERERAGCFAKRLVIVVWLFFMMSWVCLQFVIMALAFYESLSDFQVWAKHASC